VRWTLARAEARFSWDWFSTQKVGRLSFIPQLLSLFSRSDQAAEQLLYEKISQLTITAELSESEKLWLERLKELAEIRGIVFGKTVSGKKGLRQALAYGAVRTGERRTFLLPFETAEEVSLQDVTESAILVADLYWKLFDTACGTYADLAPLARQLYTDIFREEFDVVQSRVRFERLTDLLQREGGVPFLVLNLIRQGQVEHARQLTARFLTQEDEIDEEVRSSLYWLTELHWFASSDAPALTDFDGSIRYLYHLCFTNPDRAGFLEIDSQFFSQFETVSELAREGFLFKETLLEKMMGLWQEYDGLFDDIFQGVLESFSRRKSKIYDSRTAWELYWKREKHDFSREYLYVVEGNLFYSNGYYEDAASFYEKALKIEPSLRSALLNSLFAYAQVKQLDRHELMVARIRRDPELLPSSLYVIGNSYLLLGDRERADAVYEELRSIPGWEKKIEYYKSTFCFENGLLHEALEYAKIAHEVSPEDTSVSYHLSLCYNALGEKHRALEVLQSLGSSMDLHWLNYYRFTLERDAGRLEEATETLRQIPREYFEDPDELLAAIEFARDRQDLGLLRQLRSRS